MDRYAERQIRRGYKLTAKAMQVLRSMTLDADWRDGCWTGTLTELHEDNGMSRNTVPKAVDELVAKGLAVEIQPFKQGPHSPGIFLLPLYEAMVMLSKGQIQSRSSARLPTDAIALQSRSNRAENAPQSRSSTRLRPSDQVVSENRGNWLIGEEGDVEDSDSEEAICSLCKEPIAGHPFGDHEPQPRQVSSSSAPPDTESAKDATGFNPDEPCPLFDEETGEIFGYVMSPALA